MTVIGLQDFISTAIARQARPAPLISSAPVTAPAGIDASGAGQAASLANFSSQSLNAAAFTGASANVAQLGSLLQVTQGGADDIQALLQQLQNLAAQPAAGQSVSPATLDQINAQFQQLLAQIARIANQTTFNGARVLDGTFSGQQLSQGDAQGAPPPKVELPNLTLDALFGNTQPNLLTQESAQQALALIGNAKDITSKASNDLKNAQSQVGLAAASLQTAQANVDASQAVLSESDLAGLFENLLGGLSGQPASAAQLQTANLSPSLLSLLQE